MKGIDFSTLATKLRFGRFFLTVALIISLVKASSGEETQGRSVEGGKTASKAFKNGRKDPRNAALDEPVSRLIPIIVCDLAQKII